MTTYANPGAIADVPPIPNVIETTWGNAIRDRVVGNYDTLAHANAAIPSPVEGMCIYVGGSVHKFLIYAGATDTWQPPWNTAWGTVAAVEVATDQGSITTIADLTSATLAWTAVANRRYRITVCCIIQNTGAGNGNNIITADGSNAVIRNGPSPNVAAATNQLVNYDYEESGLSAGSVTRKLRGIASAGTLSIKGSTVATTQLFVEDIGANGAPS